MVQNSDHEGRRPQEKINLLSEFSGAIGDLGTFLPHVLAAITVAGLSPAGVFTGFGLFYLFSGWFYGIPMAVQPMKAASAAILVQKLTPAEAAAGGLIIGAVLLLLGLTGLINKLARITPSGVIGGIQMGLGLSLAILGMKMVNSEPVLGWLILVGILPLLNSRRFPAAIMAILVGTIAEFLLHPGLTIPPISPGIHLPTLIWPVAADFNRSFFMVVLPQLPLTLANAVLVATVISAELYGRRANRVKDRNLCLTMGIGNLIAAPFGGYMMCHGSGGITAHHRFGGRTKYAAYIIGAMLLAVGVLLGSEGTALLRVIPDAALGGLLFYSGIDLALAARRVANRNDFFLTLTVAAAALAINPAVAFVAGLVLGKALELKLIRI